MTAKSWKNGDETLLIKRVNASMQENGWFDVPRFALHVGRTTSAVRFKLRKIKIHYIDKPHPRAFYPEKVPKRVESNAVDEYLRQKGVDYR